MSIDRRRAPLFVSWELGSSGFDLPLWVCEEALAASVRYLRVPPGARAVDCLEVSPFAALDLGLFPSGAAVSGGKVEIHKQGDLP